MKKQKRWRVFGMLLLLGVMFLTGCQSVPKQDIGVQNDTQIEVVEGTEVVAETQSSSELADVVLVVEDGTYTSKEEVAAYLHQYGELPSNFITKKEAKALGLVSTERNLAEVAPGKSIGGDYFGNYEGLLPEDEDRDYYECDINSVDGNRGAERIVYSNDGLIYYTPDHYDSFELLYGEE